MKNVLDILFTFEGIFFTLFIFTLTLFSTIATSFKLTHFLIDLINFIPLLLLIHVFRERHLLLSSFKGIFEVPKDEKTGIFDFKYYPLSILIGIKRKWLFFCLIFSILFILSMSLSSLSYGVCLCFHPFQVSSTASRFIEGRSCERDKICYVYLNAPEDLRSQMIVKFHTRSWTNESFVNYDLESKNFTGNYQFKQNCFIDDLTHIISDESRFVHTCHLNHLKPNTTYYFSVGYIVDNENSISSGEKKFKTIFDDNISFIVSGDHSSDEKSQEMLKLSVEKSPDIILIGGDIVYDNGMLTCYRRWDRMLKEYEKLGITPSGHMIPLLTSVGNHESRFAQFGQTKEEIQLYLRFFTFSYGEYGMNTSVNHIHKIGSHSSIVSLDSGIASDIKSQAKWLKETWSSPEYKDTRKFALYHVPLYPSQRDEFYEVSVESREHWLPVFDQFNLSIGFENHDHSFKRTKTLKGNQISPKGTLYVGDGSFGVLEGNQNSRWYIEKNIMKYHFWMVTLNKTNVIAEAFDDKGAKIDSFSPSYE